MFFQKEQKKKKEFEEIYDKNINNIFRFVYLKVSSKDDAQDITSKVFIRLWETIHKPSSNNMVSNREESHPTSDRLKNPRAFLYTIARNMVIDYYRKHGIRREAINNKEGNVSPIKNYKSQYISLESVIIEDNKMRADERAMLNSEIEEIKTALQKIKEEYQDIIIWYYLDELTIPEIAQLTKKPEANIRVLVHRAVESLKLVLKSHRGKEPKKK